MKSFVKFFSIRMLLLFILMGCVSLSDALAENNLNHQLGFEMVKSGNNGESREETIDSTDWTIGKVTIEEAELYRKNYEEYLKKTNGNTEANKQSFQLSDKMLRVIKRQKRDAERGQIGIKIVIGAKNPNASVENLNIIYMIYPVDEDDDIIPFSRGKKVHSLCIPQAIFRVKPLCPPYCD